MSLPSPSQRLIPAITWARLGGAWLVVAAMALWGKSWLTPPLTPLPALLVFGLLFATIITASFGVVREADHLAHQLGEPYGTLILTLAIVSIEVILIASVLLGPGEAPTIGRDAIFSVMMIILNLVTGLCLLMGALRHGEQAYNAQGAITYLSMIVLLTGTALLLPNVTSGAGEFTPLQAGVVSALTVVLYAVFLGFQMRSARRLFIQPEGMAMHVPHQVSAAAAGNAPAPIDRRQIVVRALVLIAMMLPIVLLSHDLAIVIVIDYGIAALDAPVALGGVLIAIIVFTPESITAVKAALANEMQRAVNLCLGAFVSTVGLTVPAVLLIGLFTGKTVTMGISPTETLLFALTCALTGLSFIGQRTSAIQGVMHLTLFAVFALLLFAP